MPLEFFLNVSLNSVNLVTKIFVIIVEWLEAATSCVRDQDETTAPAQVAERIFKLIKKLGNLGKAPLPPECFG